MHTTGTVVRRAPWNKGKLVGQKAPVKVKDIWSIRVRLQLQGRTRDLALRAVQLFLGHTKLESTCEISWHRGR